MAYEQEIVRFTENFIIIWVDSKIQHSNKSDGDIQDSIVALHHIANSIKIFHTCESCIDFIINKVKQEKLFLIVSGSLGQYLVSQIEHDIKIDSIYIFCRKKMKHKRWASKEKHRKIMGIFTNIQDICDQLKQDIKNCEHELTSIQTVSLQTSKIFNHLDASFMYSQLLKEILLSIKHDDTSLEQVKEDFLTFCRIYYRENNTELCIIDEFEQKYSNPSPVWWYTRECFIYTMLNRALYTQDVEILIKMGFFICDLHRQLEQLHKTMDNHQILTVYRGQGMLHAAFNRMKQNQGGLISFNNFLSTTTSKEVSLCFAQNALKKSENLAILFEINIDPSISSVPFASLDKFSYFQEQEKEILFSMNTVFRIDDIRSIDNKPRLWHVNLISTSADDEQLRQLTEHMRMDVSLFLSTELVTNMDPTWRLGRLLMNMGEYEKALIAYEIMLEKAKRENNSKFEQAIHYQMSELFRIYQNDWDQVRAHLKKAYIIGMYNGNAVVDEAKNEMINAFSTIRNVLTSEQMNNDEMHSIMVELINKLNILHHDHWIKPLDPLDYQLIIDRYNYIGWVRKKQGRLTEAWTNHEQALRILREHLPPTHPRLAITYNHIASLHSIMNDHLNALNCLEKALQIQENVLQPKHPHLAETHFQLSMTFEHLEKLVDAFKHAKKAVDIGRQAFSSSNDEYMKKYQEQFDKILLLIQSIDELIL